MKNNIFKISLMLVGLCLFSTSVNAQQKLSAEEVLAKMTPEQKIKELYGVDEFLDWIFKNMMHNGTTGKDNPATSGGDKDLGIPQLRFTDGHKGVKAGGKFTTYPTTLLRGATFDKELEYRVGKAIATEMEAGGNSLFGGCTVNIIRNPRGGRTEEAYGEDTYHSGELGTEMVKGVQESGKVMALAKHYIMNSIENTRFDVSANVNERAMREVYLPQFKKMVQEGKLAAVMSSYNKINGVYASDSKLLLNDILRDEWGFDGFVISDWVNGTYSTAKSIKAGMNIEMPMARYHSKDSIMAAIDKGQITWGDVDKLVLQVIKKKMEFGQSKQHKLDAKVRANNEALAQEVAEKGIILLKNDNVLPFDKKNVKNILYVGQLAKFHNLGQKGYIPYTPNRKKLTPVEGAGVYLKGSDVNIWYTDGKNKAELDQLATRADAVVVCVGFTDIDEGENFTNTDGSPILSVVGGGDRYNMNLHQDDINLINITRRHNPNMAVVMFGAGTPVVDQWIKRAPALLVGGIPGQNGAVALAKILFGDVSPSGKLPYSIYKNENDYPAIPDSHLQAQQPWDVRDNHFNDPFNVDYGYYMGYTLAERNNIPVSFPFGFGLSYTDFNINNVQTDKKVYGANDVIKVTCKVANVGKMKGGEAVQVYVGFENAKVERPVKALKGFEKVYLEAGKSQNVTIEVPVKELAYWDVASQSWKVEHIDYTLYVGNSSRNQDLQRVQISIK